MREHDRPRRQIIILTLVLVAALQLLLGAVKQRVAPDTSGLAAQFRAARLDDASALAVLRSRATRTVATLADRRTAPRAARAGIVGAGRVQRQAQEWSTEQVPVPGPVHAWDWVTPFQYLLLNNLLFALLASVGVSLATASWLVERKRAG